MPLPGILGLGMAAQAWKDLEEFDAKNRVRAGFEDATVEIMMR